MERPRSEMTEVEAIQLARTAAQREGWAWVDPALATFRKPWFGRGGRSGRNGLRALIRHHPSTQPTDSRVPFVLDCCSSTLSKLLRSRAIPGKLHLAARKLFVDLSNEAAQRGPRHHSS
jgi:hypothetical protein